MPYKSLFDRSAQKCADVRRRGVDVYRLARFCGPAFPLAHAPISAKLLNKRTTPTKELQLR